MFLAPGVSPLDSVIPEPATGRIRFKAISAQCRIANPRADAEKSLCKRLHYSFATDILFLFW